MVACNLRQDHEHTRSDEDQKTATLGEILAKAASTAPTRALPGQPARCQRSEPPLSPRVPNAVNNYIGTRAREAPLWWHADLRQDHEHTRSDEDQKTATLGGILAEEIHKTPGKTLAGDDCNATARPLPSPRQDPCRGHQRGHSQARVCQGSTAVPMQLPAQPAEQAPAWRRAASTTDATSTCVVACRSS